MNRQSQNEACETYLLGHTPAALQRLLAQGQMVNPFTRQVLENAGLTRGMKVLDVGCGPGDVSLIAADLVGEMGSVLGIDASVEALRLAQSRIQEASLTQVSFRAENLLDLTLDQEFDAVVGRFILMHLPEPAAVVRHLTQSLRPGGIVVFQEYDLTSRTAAFYPPSPLWEQVWTWCTQPFHQAGGDLQTGMKLYGTLLEAGLPTPQMRYEAAVGAGPDWVGYEWWAETVRPFLPLIQQFGLATEEDIGIETLAERLREETVSRAGVARGPALVSAWVRKKRKAAHGRADSVG
ncbi:MAG TPA: class I SAM-dependent methyltransferase [Ktedonobacteraceae bacterium]